MLPDGPDFSSSKPDSSAWFTSPDWNDGITSDSEQFKHLFADLSRTDHDDHFMTPPAHHPSDPSKSTGHQRYDSEPTRFPSGHPQTILNPPAPQSTPPSTLSFSRRSKGPRPVTGPVDPEFLRLTLDPSVKLNPSQLGFIPQALWTDETDLKFGDLVTHFFQRKNNANSRFAHKLYNALRITTSDPFYFDFIGVEWLSDVVLKVNKSIFAQLLGIKTVDGSLFHRQGNFPSHGFLELTLSEAAALVSPEYLQEIDFSITRLLFHEQRVFVRDATIEAIENCKWVQVTRGP
jgi:hypothetical protein